MDKTAVYHRPESEFAYVYRENLVHLRLRTGRDDVSKVELYFGDPYYYEHDVKTDKWLWKSQPLAMRKFLSTEAFDFYEAELTTPTKRLDYLFVLSDLTGRRYIYSDKGLFDFNKNLLRKTHFAFRLPYFHEVDAYHAPAWAGQTVWYQIFPERFANGDLSNDPENVKFWDSTQKPAPRDFFGGDLQGVLNHLDYLTELGVNGLYFTPIFKAPSNHKYDTEDYFEIDPAFGDKAVFKKLVTEAHARGVKIMLDAVFNHIGARSPYWQDVLKYQEKSKFADWFHVNQWPASFTLPEEGYSQSTYDTFAYAPEMPKLNTANPEVQKFLLSVAEYWIREFDIDAWRLDVADEVDHQFWKKFRAACDAVKPDFYIVGEVWQSAQAWLNGDEFSGVMNYATTLLILETFAKKGSEKSLEKGPEKGFKEISLSNLTSQINAQLLLYRKQTWPAMFNTLDSHDTPRVLFECEEDRDLMKQVEALVYLLPGAPCIFYGDEVGLTGGEEPDCRRPMSWSTRTQDLNLLKFFKTLIRFRLENSEILTRSDLAWEVDDEQRILQLTRGSLTGIFNLGEIAISDESGQNILSNLVKNDKILPKGFVIKKTA